ncbi:MAG: bifunctional N(6)-L-threonylcarbamoyladenine synthase/serine/threonine protein kinase [Methanocalculus sp. MSAO_Arc1]|uniref:bifunctional N(6)-L-threonylcarbamoyladenine synthase/serine/threonine protein kinase n=1 Tax=Methanocalculus TaxID=71151 RepID=UPI000FF59F53|nr:MULTISPECIES: bifunctional N(6)-L-threonylcarbamoyladenine synthase/serine/threonine protein kinase [unclassified Methanocalculus]MCP1662627.1 N6-L-threonylcarbamoyladenine synthase/protein kinase Bud32 [Methanocalculus sp. AMF5]RQD80339.1 MAG: bifunctional N(6)-L-threonylcarbamoyladenine synthase/serine/threonine protein kinase [Methanocalculus sp. MSAO_Arc1]
MPRIGQVLGIEGTAWNLSAAVFDDDLVTISSSAYSPPHGGIHPREAAQHHAAVMKDVIGAALAEADDISAVAFSQGPGLGPCLRTVATAARSLALGLGVPLVGVNHCVAHIEIGRFKTGFTDPIVLYASGANTQVLGYLNGRYRIFGETLDIGIGNALDKFARHHALPHPGGPVVEDLAKKGSYFPLPYTVKGMDLAFSGLVSAARDADAPLPDVCCSLQETAFAMCVEVTERALAHTGKNEVILVGGVGVNARMQEMLAQMCRERGASFAVPERLYMGDNGAMIAYTGRIMLESGQTIPVSDSCVNPVYRSDQVEVTWRSDTGSVFDAEALDIGLRGAEAQVTLSSGNAWKRRLKKGYRHPQLDAELIRERTRAEARILVSARRAGVPTPVIRDLTSDTIVMEEINGSVLKYTLDPDLAEEAGRMVGKLHTGGIVHGDLTTSNMIERDGDVVPIDFGLGHVTSEIEARGVDLHVFFQTLESTREDAPVLKEAFMKGYRETFEGADDVIVREHEIELRGRYL